MKKFVKASGMPKKTIASKVATLVKKVKKMETVATERVATYQSQNNISLSSAFNTYNLSRLLTTTVGVTTTPIFGAQLADVADCGKAYLNSKDIYISIRQNNEPNLIRYSMFIVSLKDQGATTTVFDPLTRQLVGLTSSFGAHYVGVASDQIVLNPLVFNVHKTARFTMGYEGAAGPSADTYSERRFKYTIKPRQKLIQNSTGSLFTDAAQTSPIDPSQNYFVLVFNDNSGVDTENNKMDFQVIDHWDVPN